MGCGASKTAPGAVVIVNNAQPVAGPRTAKQEAKAAKRAEVKEAKAVKTANAQELKKEQAKAKADKKAGIKPAAQVAASPTAAGTTPVKGPPVVQVTTSPSPAETKAAPAQKAAQVAVEAAAVKPTTSSAAPSVNKTAESAALPKAAVPGKTEERATAAPAANKAAGSAASPTSVAPTAPATKALAQKEQPETVTTTTVVAQVTVPITADGTNKELSESLSKQIAQQVAAPNSNERENTSAENYAAANLEKSINNAISKQLTHSEAQLTKGPEKKTLLQALSTDKLSRNKSGSKESLKQTSGSKGNLVQDAPVAVAEAVSTAVAKELSQHAGDSMGQNQVANSIDAAVAKSRGNLRQDEVTVKSIEVTTEIEHDADGTPIAIHANVIAISEVPADAAFDEVPSIAQKSKSTASIAVAHVPISKEDSGSSHHNLEKTQSRKSLKEDHLSTSARQSLTQLNAELVEMKKADKQKSNASVNAQGKGDPALTLKSNPALAEPDIPPTGQHGVAPLAKSGSRASLAADPNGDKKKVTVRVKNSGSRNSLVDLQRKDKEENRKSHSELAKETMSPETRQSLEKLNQQLADERGVPLEKAASIVMDVKGSLKSLAHREKAHSDVQATEPATESHAKKSLGNLQAELERGNGKFSEDHEQAPSDASAVALAPVELHEHAAIKQDQEASEAIIEPPSHHRSVKELAEDAKKSIQNLKGNKDHVNADEEVIVVEQEQPSHHRSVKELAADAKQSIENLTSHKASNEQHAEATPDETPSHHRSVKELAADAKKSIQNLKASKEQVNADQEVAIVEQEQPSHHRSVKELAADAKQSIENLKSHKGSKEHLAQSNNKLAQDDVAVLEPASESGVPIVESAPIEQEQPSHHRSVKELAADAKQSIQNLKSNKGSKEQLAGDDAAARRSKDQLARSTPVLNQDASEQSHHRSVKELAADAAQSLQNLAPHKGSKDHLAEQSSVSKSSHSVKASASKDKLADSEAPSTAHHRSVKELAADAKQSLQTLAHKGSHDHIAADAAPIASEKVVETQEITQVDIESRQVITHHASKPQLAAKSNPSLAKEDHAELEKESHHRSVKELAADAKQSIQNLTHTGEKGRSNATIHKEEVVLPASEHVEVDKTESHHRSVKELAAEAKQSIQNLAHAHSEKQVSDGHAGKTELREAGSEEPSLETEKHHRSVQEIAADAKASLSNLAHKGSKDHLAQSNSKLAQEHKSHSHLAQEQTLEPAAESTVPIVEQPVEHVQKSSRHVSIQDVRDTKKSREQLADVDAPRHASQNKLASSVKHSREELAVPLVSATPSDLQENHGVDVAASTHSLRSADHVEAPSHHRSVKEIAQETKKSVENLVSRHQSKDVVSDAADRSASRNDLTDQKTLDEHLRQSYDNEQRQEKLASTNNLGRSGSRQSIKQSVKNLLHIGQRDGHSKEALGEISVIEAAKEASVDESAQPVEIVNIEERAAAHSEPSHEAAKENASLETSVEVDVSKHASKDHVAEDESVNVTGSVDVVPASAAADPEVRKSAEKLAQEVAHETRASARDLQEQVQQVDNAEAHVSTTSLSKAPATRSTKSIAREAVGRAEHQAAEDIQAGEPEQAKASSRPASGAKKSSAPSPKSTSRPTSASKGASRPVSPPKAPSRKASVTNLTKSSNSLSQAAERRRSGEAAGQKPPSARNSISNLAEYRASADALNNRQSNASNGNMTVARASINALHQQLQQGDQSGGSRSTLNRKITSPRGSRPALSGSTPQLNSTKTSPKASAQNLAKTRSPTSSQPNLAQQSSTTPRTSHPVVNQSNRSLAEAKAGPTKSTATLSKSYTATASVPTLNAASQNKLNASSRNGLDKEASVPQLRSGSQAGSRAASMALLNNTIRVASRVASSSVRTSAPMRTKTSLIPPNVSSLKELGKLQSAYPQAHPEIFQKMKSFYKEIPKGNRKETASTTFWGRYYEKYIAKDSFVPVLHFLGVMIPTGEE
ncbi:hypothetical protein HKX48_006290 [Thoreauomyces humboldtii]|nr:hypothetical protein HKX48_006290 [Thoreauomyces humboldtii]